MYVPEPSPPSPSSASGHLVAVEAHVGRGLPSLTITGLPGTQVSPEEVRILERLGGMDDPGQERLRFLGG